MRSEAQFATKDGYKFSYGTVNREEANSLYLFYKPSFIVEKRLNIKRIELLLHYELRAAVSKILHKYGRCSESFISDFEFSKGIMRVGVKSKLKYELFVRTNDKFKNINEYKDMMSEIAEEVVNRTHVHINKFAKLISNG